MCGFLGFINFNNLDKDKIDELSDSIFHRGPDNLGNYIDTVNHIFLSHRRLSIIDTSANGSQPMVSNSGRYVLLFNGEIYNHKTIKEQIDNYSLKGTSDTEIVLASFEINGFQRTIENLEGMFSIVLFDKKSMQFYFARDRFGEKPLYYSKEGNKFFFSSDLSFLKKAKFINKTINKEALNLYFKYNYIPSPFTIFENIFKLEPGSILEYNLNDNKLKKIKYYKIEKQFFKDKINLSFEESSNQLEKILLDKINDQLICDVNLGTFLSGGIDSSLITSIVAKNFNNNIQSFTIGFNKEEYDEVSRASLVAKHLNIDHHYEYLNNDKLISIIDSIPKYYSEPFADSSQIPSFFLSSIARKKIKVALSGDGGDELFGGYNRYVFSKNYLHYLKKYPYILRKFSKKILFLINNKYFRNFIFHFFSSQNNFNQFELKFQKIIEIMSFKNNFDIYNSLTTNSFKNNVLLGGNPKEYNPILSQLDFNNNFTEIQMLADIMTYLPDDILCKVDRASMANSLEIRSPYLNHKIAEFAFSLPLNYKINNNNSKLILRNILNKYLPSSVYDQPKTGFSFPFSDMIKKDLKELIYYTLTSNKISSLLNKKQVSKIIEEHDRKRNDKSNLIWSLLMFQKWIEYQ